MLQPLFNGHSFDLLHSITPITAADPLNEPAIPFVEEQDITSLKHLCESRKTPPVLEA